MIKAELEVSSTGRDTDCVVRVCDLYPDGRSMLVVEYVRLSKQRAVQTACGASAGARPPSGTRSACLLRGANTAPPHHALPASSVTCSQPGEAAAP